MKRWIGLVLLGVLAGGWSTATAASETGPADQPGARLQLPFLANQGQMPAAVAYYARTFAGTLFVTGGGELILAIPATDGHPGSVIRERLVDARSTAPRAGDANPIRVSYFKGEDPGAWRRGVRGFERVILPRPYPGVDLELAAGGHNVEKRFRLAAGADPARIRIRVDGVRDLQITDDGRLAMVTAHGRVHLTRPRAFQSGPAGPEAVEVAYQVHGREYGFRLGAYDPARPLVIDPLLQSTYLGGSANDSAWDLVVHPDSGNVYVVGETQSVDFPGAVASAGLGVHGDQDAFVARLRGSLIGNPADAFVLSMAYLGSINDDGAYAVTVHADSVFVGGYVGRSTGRDVLLAHLNTDLDVLHAQSTFGGDEPYCVGCMANDVANALAFDAANNWLYVAGTTTSRDFPTTDSAYQKDWYLYNEAWVGRFSPNFGARTRTYLGSNGSDAAEAVAVGVDPSDGQTYVYVGGRAGYNPREPDNNLLGYTNDFPGTAGGQQPVFSAQEDGFVARMTADLSTLVQATYIGGSGLERLYGLALSPPYLYLSGYTGVSPSWPGPTLAEAFTADPDGAGPLTAADQLGAYPDMSDSADAFVARLPLSLTLSEATRVSYFGGSATDSAYDLALRNSDQRVYISGRTDSNDLPRSINGAQYEPARIFIASFNQDLGVHHQSTYFGQGYDESFGGLDIHPSDATGQVYLCGTTYTDGLPESDGGILASLNGGSDAFVTRMDSDLRGQPVSDLQVQKTAPAQVGANDPFLYTVTVYNAGPDPATRLRLRDLLPVGVSVDSVTPAAGCRIDGPGLVSDQRFDPDEFLGIGGEYYAFVAAEFHKAQTLTFDLDGDLRQLDLRLDVSPNAIVALELDLRRLDMNGVPVEDDGNVLFSRTFSAAEVAAAVDDVLRIDLGTDAVPVNLGERLAVVARAAAVDPGLENPYSWYGITGDHYGRGEHYLRTPTEPLWTPAEAAFALPPDLGLEAGVQTDYAVVTCELGDLAAGATVDVLINVNAPSSSGIIRNRALAYSAERDPQTGDNLAQVSTEVGLTGPDIRVQPGAVDFGAVAVAEHSPGQLVEIANVGDQTLRIDRISNADPSRFVVVVSGGGATCSAARPFDLAPGQSCTISVSFVPDSAAVHLGEVRIESNDPDESPLAVPLSGRGGTPGLAVTPPALDFGDVTEGERSAVAPITLTSIGDMPVRVERIAKTGSTQFVVVTSGGAADCSPARPFELDHGDSCAITAQFAPSTAGLHQAEIEVDSNDPTQARATVDLLGTGIAGEGSDSDCFIATAAYGSPLHQHVQALREFRDRHLLSNPAGRQFVAWYYRFSPPIAAAIARHQPLRVLTRWALAPLVYAVSYPVPGSLLLLLAGTTGLAWRIGSRRRVVRCEALAKGGKARSPD